MLLAFVVLVACVGAGARTRSYPMTISKGTDVNLIFDQSLNSKTARVGDPVRFHVAEDVIVDGRTVISRGTRVAGTVSMVKHRQRYGINAKMRIAFNPVNSTFGRAIPVEARNKGNEIGNKTGQAAGATIGGAMLLGPVGLVGGYFISGKRVIVKPGDTFSTEVSETVVLRR